MQDYSFDLPYLRIIQKESPADAAKMAELKRFAAKEPPKLVPWLIANRMTKTDMP
jgi:hypothetical protein